MHVSTTTAAAFGKCHGPYLSIGGGGKGSTEKPNQPQNANSWGSEASSSSSCNSSLWKINK